MQMLGSEILHMWKSICSRYSARLHREMVLKNINTALKDVTIQGGARPANKLLSYKLLSDEDDDGITL